MSDAKTLFYSIVDRFDPDVAGDMTAVFQFEMDDADNYSIEIEDGVCNLVPGDHDDATVTLAMDLETLTDVMSGELDGMAAFMQGKIRAEGDIMLATKLTQIFPM